KLRHQRMIAPGAKILRQAEKDILAAMRNPAGLAVHWLAGAHSPAAEGFTDALMTEANAENGNAAVKLSDQGQANARLRRRTGTRGEDNRLRCFMANVIERDHVIAHHPPHMPQSPDITGEVVDKGIVIIDQQDHAAASRNQLRTVAAFLSGGKTG